MIRNSIQEMLSEKINSNFFEDYKKNFFPIEEEINDSSLREIASKLETENLGSTKAEFLIISIFYNLIYLTSQIIFCHLEILSTVETYLTLGLLACFIIICLILYILKSRKLLKIDFNLLTCFSYLYVFIHAVLITFLSYSSKTISGNNSPFIYVCDFNLILSCFLIILSCDIEFLKKYKKIFFFYIFLIIGIIIFREIASKSALLLINSISMSGLLFLFCFFLKKRKSPIKNKRVETYSETQTIFNHFNSITNELNAGIFMFSKQELFFANKTGKRILENAPSFPLNQISYDAQPSVNEIEPNNDTVDLKISMSDSKANLNKDKFKMFSYFSQNDIDNLNRQKGISLLFKNIIIYEDNLKICDRISKFKTKNGNIEKMNNNSLKVLSDSKENLLNLHSIFSFLIEAESSCLPEFKDYVKLGVFEFKLNKEKKTYYKIIVKFHCHSSTNLQEGRMIEFIFEDVTQYYDLLNKIEENQLNFKKNAHEFKTPILSLLGCAEELKATLNLIEDLLPKNEKIIIKNYLEHMTNLSSYIGYLIKGLTKSNKESNSTSNSVADYKNIKLNTLLKFCFSILQTLIGCDSQKLKQVKTKLKNVTEELNVCFHSNEIQVKQILLNFISNSVKFTNHGVIAIKAKLKKTNENDALKVTVKDTGCGVKKEDSTKLFGEYSKFNNTENNSFGTGLGLNICKAMADSLNMRIKFKSEENKGTKVILYIPNPKLNSPEKLLQSEKTWNMSDAMNNIKEINLQTSKFNEIGNNIKSEEEEKEINLENDMSPVILLRKVTTMNPSSIGLSRSQIRNAIQRETIIEIKKRNSSVNLIKSRFFHSQTSSNSFDSSITFNIDANNMKSTRRLNVNHDYDIEQLMISEGKKLKEIALKKSSKVCIDRKRSLTSKNVVDKTQIDNIPQKSCVPLKHKRVKKRCSTVSLPRIKTMSPVIGNSFIPEKIIVVDDQLHARRAIVNLINKYSKEKSRFYDIIEECDGIDCLKTIIKFPFTIKYVFMDENMSYMNGTETAEIIKKLQEAGKISIINLILTSAEEDMDNVQDIFDAIITKPLMMEDIEKILENNI